MIDKQSAEIMLENVSNLIEDVAMYADSPASKEQYHLLDQSHDKLLQVKSFIAKAAECEHSKKSK